MEKTPAAPIVHSPTSLGLHPIAHRPEVYKTCKRDINILIDQHTAKEVRLSLLSIIFVY